MKKLIDKVLGQTERFGRKPRIRRLRPGVEALEGRLVPATIQVTTLADVVNPTDGKVSLREAITLANATPAADTIVLKTGVYKIALTGQREDANATGDFDITNPLTIVGQGMNATVVDAGRLDRVFQVHGKFNANFSKLVVRNGLTDNPTAGAGLFALDANLTLNSVRVVGNVGTNGGGIFAMNGKVSLTGCQVINNTALDNRGGGIDAVNGAVTLTDTLVAGNSARNGGGVNAGQGAVTLLRSTVSGNRAADNGGGIFNGPNVVTLTDSQVRNNVAGRPGDAQGVGGLGGGIFTAAAVLTRSVVSNNFASLMGGGIYAFNGATLIRSALVGNTAISARTDPGAGDGGGMVATRAYLRDSTVSGNRSSGSGGGISSAIDATLINSTVSGNAAAYLGGGVSASAVNLTNSTFSGNIAGTSGVGGGGGVATARGFLLNCTVTENFAPNEGGGVLWKGGPEKVHVKNSIIANNQVLTVLGAMDVHGDYISDGHNLIGVINGSSGFGVNGDQTGTYSDPLDPMLGALTNNGGPTRTHALLAGSPAIDKGDNLGAPATDQRGVARARDGDGNRTRIVDIGAIER